MNDGKPYAALGEVMDGFARRPPHHVRGPHRISNYVRARVGKDNFPTGEAVSKWMYGTSIPKPEHVQVFAKVFGLTEKEQVILAYAGWFRGEAAA